MKGLLATLVFLIASAPSAQHVAEGHVCTLYDRDGAATTGPPLATGEVATARRGQSYTRAVVQSQTSTFQVDFSSGTPTDARQAFLRAVQIWSSHLTSNVPIRVEATFAPLSSNTLGQAGPRITRANNASPWLAFALADAIAGRDLFPDAATYDIVATFNSTQSAFYYGLDGRPPSNQFDFVTIVLHELGHGLGFIGSGSVDDGNGDAECRGIAGEGCVGIAFNNVTSPILFDTFLEDGQGRSILNNAVYPNNSAALASLLRSEDLFVDAPEVRRIYGTPAPVWAPVSFESGSSFSHWDEIVIRGTSAALMTPSVSRGEAYQDPGDITCAFFADMGWPLGADCQTLVVGAEDGPEVAGARLVLTGPNPARRETAFRLRLDAPAPARVALADALGREVAVLFEGTARDGTQVRVPVGSLPSGVYHVTADVGRQRVTQSITVVR